MSDFDDVLERLLVDPGFKAALAADPDGALARYRLSPDEAELLRAQVTGDTGGQGKVEERTSKASMFGLLSHFGGVGDAIHHAADHAGGVQDVGAHGGGGEHVTYETTTTTYQSTTYYSTGGQPPVAGGQGGMLGHNLGSLDLGHGAAPAGAEQVPGQGLAGVLDSGQGGAAHAVGAAFEQQPGGGGAESVGGVYGVAGQGGHAVGGVYGAAGPGGHAVGGVYGAAGQGGHAVGGAFGQPSGQGGLSAADQQYDERDYSSSSSSQTFYSADQGHGGLAGAPGQSPGYGGLSAVPDQPEGAGGLSAADDPGQGSGGLSAADDQQGYRGAGSQGGAGALGQGGGSVVGRASVGDYHVNVDVDGDGHWDDHVVVGRADGGVDVLVDSNHDGRVDFVGHDYNRDGILDDAVTDDNHDGTFDTLHIDKNGDGWMDRHVGIESHEARTYLSRHAAPDDEAR